MSKQLQKKGEVTLQKNRKNRLFVRVLVVLLSIILFMNIFNYVMNPRNGSGIHFIDKNNILTYSSPSNWLGDGVDYDVYRFNDKQMKNIIKKIKIKKTWRKYPIDSTTSELISEWRWVMENQSTAQQFMEESNIKELIPIIENGYYLLVDRSGGQSEESKHKYGLRNYSVFLLDVDTNTLYYIAFDM